jgi:hypothetical protein
MLISPALDFVILIAALSSSMSPFLAIIGEDKGGWKIIMRNLCYSGYGN